MIALSIGRPGLFLAAAYWFALILKLSPIKFREKAMSEGVKEEMPEVIQEGSPALTEAESVAQSISKVRLTLDEIMAQENEASRLPYLSPATSPTLSEASSVSSGFESVGGFSDQSSIHSVTSSTVQTYSAHFDPFRGIQDEDFSNMDRYGFILTSGFSRSAASREFLSLERAKL